MVKCRWLWKEPVIVWAFYGSVNCACCPQIFQQLINTMLCAAFFQESRLSTDLLCIYSNTNFLIKILSSSLNTTLIIDKHCSDVCCDEFPVPQIDCKSKEVKEQWHWKFYLQPVWRKTHCFKRRKYQNLHFLPYLRNICKTMTY